MKKISTRNTFFLKKVFPLLWFGFLVMFVSIGLKAAKQSDPLFLIFPAMMALLGFF